MTIKVWDYLREYATDRDEIHAAVDHVLASGCLILGESVRRFEAAFAAYCGVRFGVGVNSGTDALTLALRALGLGPGDEVVTVSNTAVPTVAAVVATGATPVFVDIEPRTYLMDTAQLEAAVGPRTRCILPVHLFGQCVAMETVNAVASRHGLKVLEDCAQSHGAARHGRKAGAWGHAAAFSFYPTKVLGGYGDGGMVCTDDADLAAHTRRLRFYGMEQTYYSIEHGYNSRLDELHAEILLRRLARLDAFIQRRRDLAARYDRLLADTGLILPQAAPGNAHAYYLYVCRHPRRDDIIAGLKEHDIVVNVSYRWPIHDMPAYRGLCRLAAPLPRTEQAAREIFSLPLFPTLTDAEQDRVCAVLHDILRRVAEP